MGTYVLWAFLALVVILAAVNLKRIRAGLIQARMFLREVRVEMQKVTWPTRNDLIGSTVVVMAAIVALTVAITLWDFVLSWVVRFVLSGGGA